jgi:hypothetical protein
MKITVKVVSTFSLLNVRRPGFAQGMLETAINNMYLARAIDRASLRGRRIVHVGAEEFGDAA